MYHKLLLASVFHSIFGTCAFFSQSILNPFEYLVQEICNQTLIRYGYTNPSHAAVTFLWSVLNACFPIGYLLSTLVIASCTERFGRKSTTMVINNILLIVSSLLMWIGKEVNLFELMIIGRTIGGICIQVSNFGLIYLTECSDIASKGNTAMILRYGCIIWHVLGATCGLPDIMGRREIWGKAFLVPIIPAFIHLLGAFWMPDSPKHLYITKGQKAESIEAILFYQGPDVDIKKVTNAYEAEMIAVSGRDRGLKIGEVLKIKHLRWPFMICLMAEFSCRLGGYDIENFYSTGIIHQLGVSLKMAAIFNVLILRFPSIIFMLLILVLSRKLKSRPYLLGSLIGGLISITLLFCVQLYDHFIPNSQISAAFGLASLFLGISCWHLGSGYLPKFLPAECCPQISRSQTTAYQVAVRGFTSIIITVLYPTLAAAIGGPLALLPVMICGYLSVAWLCKYLPETKDKSVDEVVKEWMDPDSECEAYPIIGGEVQQPPDDLTLSLTLSVEC